MDKMLAQRAKHVNDSGSILENTDKTNRSMELRIPFSGPLADGVTGASYGFPLEVDNLLLELGQ
jgi:hypothetical protein